MKKSLILLFKACLIVATILAIYKFIGNFSLSVCKETLNQLPWFWTVYLLISFMAYLCSTYAWTLIDTTKSLKKIGFFKLFMIRNVGENFASLNPTGFIAGDYIKYKLILKNSGFVNKEHLTKDLILLRLYHFYGLLILVAIVGSIYKLQSIYAILFVCCFYIYFLFFNTYFLKRCIHFMLRMISRLAHIFKADKMKEELSDWAADIETMRFSKLALFAIILHWLFGGLEVYMICNLLQIPLNLTESIVLDSFVVVVKSFASFVPAQVGIEEFANSLYLGLIQKVSLSAIVSFVLLRRLRQVFWIAISCIYYLIYFIPYRKISFKTA